MSFSRRTLGWMLTGLLAASAAPAMAVSADDWPNVFIAPMGKPFRAKVGAPYPVVDWFKAADKNGDGKIDHAEFIADAAAFFDVLDVNHDGNLSSYEVAAYERVVAPEVLGLRINVGDLRGRSLSPDRGGAHLWLAQFSGGPTGDIPIYKDAKPAEDTRRDDVDTPPEGAGPYSLQIVPEPLSAADVDFSGVITKANYLKVADRRFNALDREQDGFLVLAKLPKTYVQLKIEQANRKGFLHF